MNMTLLEQNNKPLDNSGEAIPNKFIPEPYPDIIPEYWINSPKLNWDIAIKWIEYNNFYVTYQDISSSSDIRIDTGFEPKVIRIDSLYKSISNIRKSMTLTTYINSTLNTNTAYFDTNWITIWNSAWEDVIYLNYTWAQFYADITSIDKTWFTIWNITYNSETIWVHITVIW